MGQEAIQRPTKNPETGLLSALPTAPYVVQQPGGIVRTRSYNSSSSGLTSKRIARTAFAARACFGEMCRYKSLADCRNRADSSGSGRDFDEGRGGSDDVDVLSDLFPRAFLSKVDSAHEVDDLLA